MGIVFRQSLKTTVISFVGALLGAFFNYFAALVLLQQKFGVSRNLINNGAIIQLFALMGTAALLQTYARRYPAGDKRRGALFTVCLIVPALSMLVFLIPYFAFRSQIIGLYQPDDVPFIAKFYAWLPVLALLFSYMTLIDSYLIAHVKIALSSFAREILLRVFNLAILALYFFHKIDFNAFIILTAFSYGVPLLMMLYVASRTEGFAIHNPFNIFSRSERAELAKFSFFHFLAGISVNLIGYIDSIMLAPLDKAGMNALAVYSIALFIVTITTIPYRAMAASSFTPINQAYLENDELRLQNLFHRSSLNILIVTVIMMVIIGCNLENVVAILPGYAALKPLVLILMIGRLVDMATGTNNDVIGISKYYKFGLYISAVLLLFIIILNRWLIPLYGFYGAAWATTISLCVINIGKMIYLWKKMRLQPFSLNSAVVLLAGMVAAAGGEILPFLSNPFADAIIRTCLVIMIYFICILWWKPSEDISTVIRSMREKFK